MGRAVRRVARGIERGFRSVGRGFERAISRPLRDQLIDPVYQPFEDVVRGTGEFFGDIGDVITGKPQEEALEEQKRQFEEEKARIDAENARAKAEADFQKQVSQTASQIAQGQEGAEEVSTGATVAFQDKLKAKVDKDKLLKALRI